MSLRQIVRFNDKSFRKVSRTVENYDERLWILLDDMFETLKASGGYGITAAHIGILRRVVVIDENPKIELVNPVITARSEAEQRVFEGSIAGDAPWGFVVRPSEVTVAAFDRFGKAVTQEGSGFLAATLCHEIDCLNGILFTEKADEIVSDPEKINRLLKQNAKKAYRGVQ
jgi:peptide deformylase